MDKKLYYCDYWQKKNISDYSYCLSDLIFQNEKDTTLAQIHGIILFKDSILKFKKEQISVFEEEIRDIVRNVYKESIIKIWYYNEDDSKFDVEHIPSRFAITIQVSEGINKANILFLNDLEKCIISFIKKCSS
ncbi:hypothetical protein [Treponema sp. Marseille-Q3903]|uniref:hypothetical protein n=1 Tax=Treponema sp. Marseille-Q3903 TaxID=2766703 RepID=UPI001652676F|nr:hypothetical protein [Treponema sp. Marseille-Q3903]MBC6712414.1 hypothetical protein [Treponema sp. Marseille-Q3903]